MGSPQIPQGWASQLGQPPAPCLPFPGVSGSRGPPERGNGRGVWGGGGGRHSARGGHFVASNPQTKGPCVTQLMVTDGGTVSGRRVTPGPPALPGPRKASYPSRRPQPPAESQPGASRSRGRRAPSRGRARCPRSALPGTGPGPLPRCCPVPVPVPVSLPPCRRLPVPVRDRRRPAVTPQPGGAPLLPGVPPLSRPLTPQPPAPARPHGEEQLRRPRARAGRAGMQDRSGFSRTAPPPTTVLPRQP